MTCKKCLANVLIAVFVIILIPVLLLLAAPQESAEKTGAELVVANGNLVYWMDVKEASRENKTFPGKPPVTNVEDPCKIISGTKEIDFSSTPLENSETSEIDFGSTLLEDSKASAGTRPLISFEGLNLMGHGSGWPPSTSGDVGVRHYVQAVHTSFAIFDKATGASLGVRSFDDFFPAACGVPCDYDNNSDPIVMYDQINRRWIMMVAAWTGTTNGSYFSIAASQTSDPTGAWWTYCFKADDLLLNSSPRCGVWQDGIYVTANMFAFGGAYNHSKIWAIKTPDLYNGTLTAQSTTTSSVRSFSMIPSCFRGQMPAPVLSPNYLYSIDANEFGGSHTDALHVWQYKVNWSNPARTTLTGPVILPVAPYDLTSSRVPQLGTTWTLDSMYGRLMFPVTYRRTLTNSNEYVQSVYLCHVAEYMGSRAMRWYEVRIKNGVSSIFQQGTFAPDATHRWMGSICANAQGSIALAYSASSTQMYPAIRYTGWRRGDQKGVMGLGEKTLIGGTGSQSRISRWGDYSMMTIDPVDDKTFWYTNEYYLFTAVSPQLPDWHTRIGSFRIVSGESSIPPGAPGIAAALDIPGQNFMNKGTREFEATTASPYFGSSCVGNPAELTDNESCRLEATINGKTTVKFWWKVSSEDGWDYLNFYIDGVLQDRISGEAAWGQQAYTVSSSPHTLAWAYIKDSADSAGADTGWIDNVEIY